MYLDHSQDPHLASSISSTRTFGSHEALVPPPLQLGEHPQVLDPLSLS